VSNGRSRFKARMGPGFHIRGKDLVFHPLTSLPSEGPGSEGTRRSQGRSGPSRPRIARFGVESQPFPPKNRHRVRRIAAPVESRIVVSAGTPGHHHSPHDSRGPVSDKVRSLNFRPEGLRLPGGRYLIRFKSGGGVTVASTTDHAGGVQTDLFFQNCVGRIAGTGPNFAARQSGSVSPRKWRRGDGWEVQGIRISIAPHSAS